MRIDQVDPMVMLHIETNKDGSRELRVRGILRGANVAEFAMPLVDAELADLRGHASELCARTLDAIGAVAHTMPDDTGDPTSVDTATVTDLDQLADLVGVPRHGDRIGGVLDLHADQRRIPRSQVANAYNAMRNGREPRRDAALSSFASRDRRDGDADNPMPPHRLVRELQGSSVDRVLGMWGHLDRDERLALLEFCRVMRQAPEDRAALNRWRAAGRPRPERAAGSPATPMAPPPASLISAVPPNEANTLIEIWHTLDRAERDALTEFVNRFARTPTPAELRTFRMLRDPASIDIAVNVGALSPTAVGDAVLRSMADRRERERVTMEATATAMRTMIGPHELDATEVQALNAFRARYDRDPDSYRDLRDWMGAVRHMRPAPTSIPSGGDPSPR